MRLSDKSRNRRLEEAFQAITEKRISDCYQCMKCSAGCPFGDEMEEKPHQIMMLAKLGLYHRVLASSTLWTCAACMTCSARCPRDMEPALVMEGFRALTARKKESEPGVPAFKEGVPPQAYIAAMRKRRG